MKELLFSAIPGLEKQLDDGKPFVRAVLREKLYKASHGSVKVTEQEKQGIELNLVEEENRLCFCAEGHKLYMKLTACAGGFDAELQGEKGWAYEFRIPALENEAVFGGGEQYRQTNLKNEKVVNFVSEHIKASTIVEKALLPKKLYREKKHSQIGSYSPMPVFTTDKGRLFLFDTGADGFSEFGNESYVFSFDRCPESMTFIKGESYEQLQLQLASRYENRQYIPQWCHDGMILGIQGGSQVILDKSFAMLDAGAKICGVWSQDWSGENITAMGKQVWWNWQADEKLYPDLKGTIKKLNERGVRFLAYINPYLVKDSELYKYCEEKGYLIKKRDGSIYHIKSTTFDAGMLDLTNPEACVYIKEVLIKKNMLELGVSGYMADFGEYLPIDCVLHEGESETLHNRWPVLWAKLNREAIEEYGDKDVMFFTRSGYLGIQSYAPMMWNGDQHTDYTKDYGLPCVMPASFSLGFSGVSMVHCDIGGFFSFGKLKRDGELFTRWMEMCCFSLLMRSHEAIRPWANSQFDAEDVKEHTVRLTNIHSKLKPYISHCAHEAERGVTAIRPDFWYEMDFGKSRDMYSYFLGDELYVCPVIEQGSRCRTVHLPDGDWVHFWSGTEYTGGSSFTVDTPLGFPAVFYRRDGKHRELFKETASQYRKG